jgi:hypothetical protein
MAQTRLLRNKFWSTDTSLSAFLIFLLLLIFVFYPLGELGVAGGVLIEILFSIMLISGVMSVSKSKPALVVMITLGCGALLTGLSALLYSNLILFILKSFFVSSLVGALVVIILVEVFREGRITFRRIQGAIAAYLLIGILWAMFYRLIFQIDPAAFLGGPSMIPDQLSGFLRREYIYFSFGALTTMDYKGMSAVHPLTQSLVMLEALIGQLFPAILLARLVSMEVESRKTGHE